MEQSETDTTQTETLMADTAQWIRDNVPGVTPQSRYCSKIITEEGLSRANLDLMARTKGILRACAQAHGWDGVIIYFVERPLSTIPGAIQVIAVWHP